MATRWNSGYSVYRKYIHEVGNLYRNRQDVRAFTELILSLFTVAIFGAFAIRPTLVTIAQLSTEIQSKEDTLTQLNQKIDNLGKAKTIYSQEASRILLLGTAIPNDPTPHTYIRQLEGLIKKDQVELVGMDIDRISLSSSTSSTTTPEEEVTEEETPVTPLDVQTYGMSLTLTGSYVQLADFLKDLENLRRPLIFEITNIGVAEVDSDQVQILLTVTGAVPYQPSL